jgi:hypothetical protein
LLIVYRLALHKTGFTLALALQSKNNENNFTFMYCVFFFLGLVLPYYYLLRTTFSTRVWHVYMQTVLDVQIFHCWYLEWEEL